MSDGAPAFDSDLLCLCAILNWFDSERLLSFSANSIEVPALLASDLVISLERHDGVYRLHPAVAERVLAQLRTERPQHEWELHRRACDFFLRRMERQAGTSRSVADEEACFHHLQTIVPLLFAREAWQTLMEYVAAARAAVPQQLHHLHRLTYYEVYATVHSGAPAHERGEAMLTALLASHELEDYTRIRALNLLAHLHSYRTHYNRALEQYQQVYEVARDIGDLFHEGAALINMGMVYNDLMYYERALELTQQSLEIFQRLPDRSTEVFALYEIGNCALQLGRWSVAETHFEAAFILAERLALAGRLASICWGQGLLFHMIGDVARSEEMYRRGLAIAQSPDHHNVMTTTDLSWYLGFLLSTQRRSDEALDAYQQALVLASAAGRPHLLSLIHFQRGNLFKRQGLLDAARAAYEEAINHIESLRAATEGEEIKLGLLGTTQQLYEAMIALCVEQGQLADAFNYVERARSRAFLDTLARKDAALYGTLDQPVATLGEVQASLPEEALLLEYFAIGVVPSGENAVRQLPADNAHLRDYLTLPPQLLLFGITRDDFKVWHVDLDPNALQPPPGISSPMRRLLRPRHLTYLYEQLIGPAQSLLRHYTLLFLVPHGPLHYVPWMALRSASGDYLLDKAGPAIALAPSATILLRNCLARPPYAGKDFLALGYNGEGEEALQYAELEARFVARLMNGDVWVGAEPKSRRLVERTKSVGWLHISGHGIYNPRAPLNSALRLGVNDMLSARTIMSELDLSATLVTLSACTSGLNQIASGDELLGLPRAFLYAGAPTVICTPWEAADLAALLVMERFYSAVRQGHSPATALRDAQVSVRTMTGREFVETWTRWQSTTPAGIALPEFPDVPLEQLEQPLFADPTFWALFTLVGQPE